MIEDFFTTEFKVYKPTESRVKGVNVRTFAPVGTTYTPPPPDPQTDPPTIPVPVFTPTVYYGAFFTPSQLKTVLAGKIDVLVTKTLYCPVTVPLEFGDYVEVGSAKYDVVVEPINTLTLGHHYTTSLSVRI